jgi:hypothetical protein
LYSDVRIFENSSKKVFEEHCLIIEKYQRNHCGSANAKDSIKQKFDAHVIWLIRIVSSYRNREILCKIMIKPTVQNQHGASIIKKLRHDFCEKIQIYFHKP